MTSEEEFIAWLKDSNCEPFIADEGGYQNYILKVPKTKQFVYLYCQSCYGQKGIERNSSFTYAGFYNRENEMIYDSGIRFMNICPKHVSRDKVSEIYGLFDEKVRKRIAEIVENNLDFYRNLELSEEQTEKLETYATYFQQSSARDSYLLGIPSEEISYEAQYHLNKRNDDALLSIIANPLKEIENEAANYIAEHEGDILIGLKENELKKTAMRALEGEDDGNAQRVKRIIDAMYESGAKSVKVTVNKNGEEFSFKVSTDTLKRDPHSQYSVYELTAAEREMFWVKFGRHSNYSPEEIVDISYRGKSIYSAQPYEPEQNETSGMTPVQG